MYEWAVTLLILAAVVGGFSLLAKWALAGWSEPAAGAPGAERGRSWRYSGPPAATGLGWMRYVVWPAMFAGILLALMGFGLPLFGILWLFYRQFTPQWLALALAGVTVLVVLILVVGAFSRLARRA